MEAGDADKNTVPSNWIPLSNEQRSEFQIELRYVIHGVTAPTSSHSKLAIKGIIKEDLFNNVHLKVMISIT